MRDMITLQVLKLDAVEDVWLMDDQIGLQPGMYQRLFDHGFDRNNQSRPWRRGIILVEHRLADETTRRIRLLFRGVTAAGVTQSVCLLPPIARSQLGVRGDSSRVTLQVEPQLFARFLFYWNHPSDAARVAFKLGGLALGIAVVQFAFC